MTAPIQKISINDVSVGMHIEDVFNEKGFLLYSYKSTIDRISDIDRLKNRGVTFVYARTFSTENEFTIAVKSKPPVPQKKTVNRQEKILSMENYRRELRKARAVYTRTIDSVSDVIHSARMNRIFSLKPLREATIQVVSSIKEHSDVLISLSQIKDFSDDEHVHAVNVSILASALAYSVGYRNEELEQICMGALLHDIGKMKIAKNILAKKGHFTRREKKIIEHHPNFGVELVSGKRGISQKAIQCIRNHHERYDGGGYPLGMAGDEIPEAGYITGLAEMYDSLTSAQTFRSGFMPQESLAIIFQGANRDFPRNLVEHFARMLGVYPVGSYVELESGERGIVIKVNNDSLLEPVVLVLSNSTGVVSEPYEFDLSARSHFTNEKNPKIIGARNPVEFNVEPARYLEEMLLNSL